MLPCGISLEPNSRLGVSFFHLLEHVLQGLHIVMEAKRANHGRSITLLVKALLSEKAGFDLMQQKTKAATANLDNVPKDVSEAWDRDFHFKTVGKDYRYEFLAGASMRWDLSLSAIVQDESAEPMTRLICFILSAQTHLRALRLVAGSFAGQVHDSTGHDGEDAPDPQIRKPLSLECP